MRTFFLYVDGEPVAKGRPRCGMRWKSDGSGMTPYVTTPPKTKDAEREIWATFKHRYPGVEALDEPFCVTIRFFEGVRQREKWQDLDNLCKTVLDALNTHAWTDDRLCTTLTAVVVRGSSLPHTEIDIRTLSPSEEETGHIQIPLEEAV